MKSALYPIKRALYSIEIYLYSIKRVVYFVKGALVSVSDMSEIFSPCTVVWMKCVTSRELLEELGHAACVVRAGEVLQADMDDCLLLLVSIDGTIQVCCSALPCVAERCSALQCVAVYCSVLPCVVVCCSVLPSVEISCSQLQSVAPCQHWQHHSGGILSACDVNSFYLYHVCCESIYGCEKTHFYRRQHSATVSPMGWLRSVGSIKL